MPGTLLFIHGTGVRKAGYDDTMARITAGLKKAGRADIKVVGELWGDNLGVRIDADAIAKVLPPAATKALGPGDAGWPAMLWERLLADPLFELRMASIRDAGTPATTGAPLPGRAADAATTAIRRLQALAAAVSGPLPGGVATNEVAKAAEFVATAEELAQAALAAPGGADDGDLNDAIARAVVARALVTLRGPVGTGPDALFVAADRDALVKDVRQRLVPATKGLGGWLSSKIKGAAGALATNYGQSRRDSFMVGGALGGGDILLYQRRGGAILDAIEKAILAIPAADGPIVALGHSLGGIMLVDLLTRARAGGPLPVANLVTVGSQAPALLECDALETLRKGQAFPTSPAFPRWLNFYDRNDFLSFCASRCLSPANGVEDFEIRSGVPFPDAHSAYFRQDAFYSELAKKWP